VPDEPGALLPSGLPPSPPLSAIALAGGEARWVAVVGRLEAGPRPAALLVDGASVRLDHRCDGAPAAPRGVVSVTGVLVGEPPRLVVPCGGIAPAPLLARATAPREPTGPATSAGALTEDVPTSPSGVLPAVMLLLAAATLGVGAGVARWRSHDDTPEPGHGQVAPEEAEEAPAPPNLTLVPMPRERAP